MISKKKLKAFKRVVTSKKSDDVKAKRVTRSRALLRRFDNEAAKNIVFTDEKDFTLEPAINAKNDVVYGRKGGKKLIPSSRLFFSKVAVLKKSDGYCRSIMVGQNRHLLC